MAGGLITNYINKGSGAPSVAPSVPTGESAYYYDETNGDLYVYNTTSTVWHLALSGVFSGEVSGTDLKATGLTGTALSVRLRGGNASGAPSTGTGVVRDLAVNSDGSIYICTTAGSPGTWTAVSGGGGSSTLAGDTDVTISSPAAHDILQYSGSTWANVQGGMIQLQKTTLGSAAATITLNAGSSIPGTYSALRILIVGRVDESTTDDWVYAQFNGDTGSNYDDQTLSGVGSSATAGEAIAATKARLGDLTGATATANMPGIVAVDIPLYAGTTFYKQYVSESFEKHGTGAGTQGKRGFGGQWRSTAAITSITLLLSTGNLITGTTAILYGIA